MFLLSIATEGIAIDNGDSTDCDIASTWSCSSTSINRPTVTALRPLLPRDLGDDYLTLTGLQGRPASEDGITHSVSKRRQWSCPGYVLGTLSTFLTTHGPSYLSLRVLSTNPHFSCTLLFSTNINHHSLLHHSFHPLTSLVAYHPLQTLLFVLSASSSASPSSITRPPSHLYRPQQASQVSHHTSSLCTTSLVQLLTSMTGKDFTLGSHSHHHKHSNCLLYTSPSPRDGLLSRMPSSA